MRKGRRPATAAVLATAAALVLMTGCSTGGDDGATPSASTSSSTSASTSASPTSSPSPSPTPTLTGAATTPVARPPGDAGFGLLTAVRLASHPGYDRFVLEFADAVPGYEVRYVDRPVVADPSGETVVVAGDHVLAIRMEPASRYDLQSGTPSPGYDGPTRIPGGSGSVQEAVMTGDFEAVMQWVLGVDGKQPFLVTELSSPPRLVIDVASG